MRFFNSSESVSHHSVPWSCSTMHWLFQRFQAEDSTCNNATLQHADTQSALRMCHSRYFTGREGLQEGRAGKARGELPFEGESSGNARCSASGQVRSQLRAHGSGSEGRSTWAVLWWLYTGDHLTRRSRRGPLQTTVRSQMMTDMSFSPELRSYQMLIFSYRP